MDPPQSSPAFKANVALAVMQDAKTIAEIAHQFEVHPTQVTEWCPDLNQPASTKPGRFTLESGQPLDQRVTSRSTGSRGQVVHRTRLP